MGCCNSKKESSNNTDVKKTEVPPTNPEKKEKEQGGVAPGTLEAKYSIGDIIGKGAFSTVKSAKNKQTGQEVAVKFIEKKVIGAEDMAMLAREIDIMKKVSHDNVLKLVETFETEFFIALVMELVNGGELFYKIVERGNYSEPDAAKIVNQICKGVTYLHGQGIAHRDLKPENLLCSSDSRPEFSPFRVVIADFGLSKAFDDKNPLETSCGTPDYVAPEVITAEGTYDKSVDMWSVGVITYVLLCGYSPFFSTSQQGLFEKIIKADFSFPDPEWGNISSEAKDFIRHLLLKEPGARYAAEKCLEHPWLNGKCGSEDVLSGGKISSKLAGYNEQRKASFLNTGSQANSQKEIV